MEESSNSIALADLIITIAYFSIPLQLLASLYQYPKLARMPLKLIVLMVLFALFIFLCGAGHFLRCLYMHNTDLFQIMNALTAVVSLVTALYLLPLIPNLMSEIDKALRDTVKLNRETEESKNNLLSFMAFICHEIRTPLWAVTSSAQFLKDTEMTEDQQVNVCSIFDASLLMLRLVNDVLDISKIDAGKLQLEKCDFDLHHLLEKLEMSMRLQVRQKHRGNVEFRFDIAPDVPRIVHGDSTRMLQIVYNLISNSCKFTKEGYIRLSVSVEDFPLEDEGGSAKPNAEEDGLLLEDEGGSAKPIAEEDGLLLAEEGTYSGLSNTRTLKIVAEDTGEGIDEGRLKDIFKPYSQTKLSDYRKHGGTGLGLSIISSLLKLMGGDISVESTVGQGSTFTLHLPVCVPLNQDQEVGENLPDLNDPFMSAKRLPVFIEENLDQATQCRQRKRAISAVGDSADLLVQACGQDSGSEIIKDVGIVKNTSKYTNATANARPSTSQNLNKFSAKSKVVLVVDDNLMNRKILAKMLSYFNLNFKLAVHGQEAIDIMKTSRNVTGKEEDIEYGLIFMDLQMPVLDGFVTTRILRSMGVKAPIVALTANALSREKQGAYEAGATEFQTKPILRENLHSICLRYLGNDDAQ